MSDTQSSNNSEITQLQVRAYSNSLDIFPNDDPLDHIREHYDTRIRDLLKYHNKPMTVDSCAMPSAELRREILQKYLQTRKEIESLFAQGDCLCFDLRPDGLPACFQKKFDALERESWKDNRYEPTSPMCVFNSLHSGMTYFSNGLVLYASDTRLDDFVAKVKAKGYEVQEIRKVPFAFMKKIRQYASVLYFDQLKYEKRLEPKEFAEKLLDGGRNVCLSLSGDINISNELRKKYLLFKDGHPVMLNNSDRSAFDWDEISIFEKTHLEHVFLLCHDFVSKEYLAEIERQSRAYSWYVPEEEYRQQYNARIKPIQEAQEPTPEITPEIRTFIANLCKDNRCLSLLPLDDMMPYENEFAIFEDGRCIVVDQPAYSQSYFHLNAYENKIRYLYPNIVLRCEKVPAFYLPLIYREIYKKQKSAIQVCLEKLKKKAKELKAEENISHHEALDIVAQCQHFSDWRHALHMSMKDALLYLQEEERIRKVALIDFSFKVKDYDQKHDLKTLEEAQTAFAQEQGFASWTRMMLQDRDILERLAKYLSDPKNR